MSDPIAQAAQQIQHEDKPQGIAGEIVEGMHKLEAMVEHLIHPDAPAVAQSGESVGSTSQPVADTTVKSSEQEGTGEGNATALTPSGSGSASSANDALAGSLAAAGAADAPNAAGGASSGEQAAAGSVLGATDGAAGERGNGSAVGAEAAPLAAQSSAALTAGSSQTSAESAGEHPHTGCLRRIVGLLRRDFAMLPGELEAWVKTAERHL